MLRRTLPIRIVVTRTQPEERRFDFDPYEEAKRDRMQILAAAFTILRAWWEHGNRRRQGPSARPLGSFERVGGPRGRGCEWLTGTNPIALIEERKAEDPGRAEEMQVIAGLI